MSSKHSPQNKNEKQVEIRFFSSLLFLILSLTVSLTVFLKFRPKSDFYEKQIRPLALEKKSVETVKSSSKIHVTNIDTKARETKVTTETIAQNLPQSPKLPSLSDQEMSERIKAALDFVNQGEVKKAKEIFENILQSNPNHEESLLQLGLIHLLDLKDDKSAQPLFEKALSLNPDNKMAMEGLIDIYTHSEDKEHKGVEYLEALYEKTPNTNIAIGIGEVLMEDNPKAAIPYLEKAGDQGLNRLGELYVQMGTYDKAYDTFQRREDLLTSQIDSGDGDIRSFAKEELIHVKTNMVQALIAQGKKELADQKLNELKPLVGEDFPELVSLLESSAKNKRVLAQ